MESQRTKPRWYEKGKKNKAESKELTIPKQMGRPKIWTDEMVELERLALDEWMQDPNNYYLDAFICDRGYNRDQFAIFCRTSKEFLYTSDQAKLLQERRLVQLALTKEHDGNFTKFVLANRAGWKERTELSGDVKNPLSFVLSSIDSSNKDITIDANAITDESKDE